MSTLERQGLLKKSTLTEAEIAEIASFVALCKAHDNLRMRISLKALRQRSGNEIDDFFYFERDALVGYLYVDSWGKEEKEFTGMVLPEMRRRGIFRQLFEAARAECKPRGVECLILVCEHQSPSGHAFARAIKAKQDFSEHEMVLGSFLERRVVDPQFQMRPATPDDKEALVAILETDTGDDEDAREMVEELYKDHSQHIYLSTLADAPLGCLRLDYQDEAVGIYGFVVRPEYRGRGHGRQMLEYIIRRIYDEGARKIMLEVETTNHNAIGLYRSCGFEITTTYDYYNCNI